MESGGTAGRAPWPFAIPCWLRRWARGSAATATAAPLFCEKMPFRRQRQSRSAPAMLQPPKGPSGPKSHGQQEAAAQAQGALGPMPDNEMTAASVTGTLPKLHFCEDTNEPADVCNSQWLVLWSFAAYAPEYPSEDDQKLLRTFFESFPDQCTEGRAANCYTEAVRNSPPRVRDRRELFLWLCMIENQCRMKAGMPLRQCRHSELIKRWRYTDGYL